MMRDPMRFACLNTVAPGKTFAAQCAAIAEAGCTGVETIVFPGTNWDHWQREMQRATQAAGISVVVAIIGGLALHREDQMSYVQEAIHAVCGLGAAVLLTPEYATQDPLPLFPPFSAPPPDEKARVDAALEQISAAATRLGARVFIEPITQFESRFCRDVETAVAMCAHLDNPRVQLALDTHNMNITEARIDASIRHAGRHIGHMHLSDNNRWLPGLGHIDFAGILHALRDVSYSGWFTFECAVPGDFVKNVREALARLRAASETGHGLI